MIGRLVSALLNLACWLERHRSEPEPVAPIAQPYEPPQPQQLPEQHPELVVEHAVYLHRPANMPVQCSCVERKNGYFTTRPSCKRCFGLGALRS